MGGDGNGSMVELENEDHTARIVMDVDRRRH